MGEKEGIKKAVGESAAFFILVLVSVLVRNGEFLSSLSSSSCENGSTARGGHSVSETMFVSSFPVVWLKCTFHCNTILSNVIIFLDSDDKGSPFFDYAKEKSRNCIFLSELCLNLSHEINY